MRLAAAALPALFAVPAMPAAADEQEAAATVERILSIDGDAAYGEYLGGECATCHRQSGSTGTIPAISGLPAEYLVEALVEYRLGLRTNDVMRLMTARLSEEEIAALAAYFSRQDDN